MWYGYESQTTCPSPAFIRCSLKYKPINYTILLAEIKWFMKINRGLKIFFDLPIWIG
jgi:hypothetical protein